MTNSHPDPVTDKLVEVVGVRFRRAGKIYDFAPEGLSLRPGDYVIVDTSHGPEYGQVVVKPRWIPEGELMKPLRKVLRTATSKDRKKVEDNRERAREAFRICVEQVAAHGLAMKVVSVDYNFDRSKLMVYFTAEERVDFRSLVRSLASTFKTRIELRQIGVRDEAKLVGGLGPCGRLLCCTTFLAEFEPVSIRMAKEQNLSLSSSKLTGLCGRLKCCLRYENDTYVEARSLLPREGVQVETSQGVGRVVGLDFLSKRVKVRLADETVSEFHHEDVRELT